VVQTSVGYAGGNSVNPTYHNLDGHSETTQLQFNPAVISYERLLEIFWGGIEPTRQVGGRQYANIIFYHSDEQKRQAEESKQRLQEHSKQEVFVDILPYKHFYPAEDYHQKYYLQQSRKLMQALESAYPNFTDLVQSTAAARLNAFRAGFLTQPKLRSELTKLDLPQTAFDQIMEIAAGSHTAAAH
jgi:peptide-methionine (S)-S-oxide reductase